MSKYDKELMAYGKASGAFQYAAKRSAEDRQNQKLKNEAKAAFDELEKVAFSSIENAYSKNPGDKDAESAYEIASADLTEMRKVLLGL